MPTFTDASNNTWRYMLDASNAIIGNGFHSGATTSDSGLSGAIVIPSALNGYPVTSINARAFSLTSITSISIPDSVTSILTSAFYNCTGLTSITLNASSIGPGAFQSCSNLASVTIGASVISIADYCFINCTSLVSINIPDSVTSIGTDRTFEGTSSNLTVTMKTKTIGGTQYTSPTAPGPDIAFFGNSTVTLVEPPPPLTMTITSTTVTSGSTTNNTPIALTFTSSASTTDFVVDDISVTNGTLSAFVGSGTVYTATFTPNGQGPVACTINVQAGAFTAAGLNNNASNTFTFIYDAAPTMTITSTTVTNNATTNVKPIELTFTSSEAITGFTKDDISFNNGTLSDLTVSSDTVYTATFTPTIQGAYTINVPVGAFTANGLNNTAASKLKVNVDAAVLFRPLAVKAPTGTLIVYAPVSYTHLTLPTTPYV